MKEKFNQLEALFISYFEAAATEEEDEIRIQIMRFLEVKESSTIAEGEPEPAFI